VSDCRLLVDQGNTRLKWAWASGDSLDEASTGRGDLAALLATAESGAAKRPRQILVSSVAGPQRDAELRRACLERWRVEPRWLKPRAEQGGVRNGYTRPESLGVDRWLAIVGAVSAYGAPVVVWDLGTAATLDAVDTSGQHLGGWILPGPAAMLDALKQHTQLKVPDNLAGLEGLEPGRATRECIGGGVLAAQVGALKQFMERFAAATRAESRLVVAGGAATEVLGHLDIEYLHDTLLVFRGMLVD